MAFFPNSHGLQIHGGNFYSAGGSITIEQHPVEQHRPLATASLRNQQHLPQLRGSPRLKTSRAHGGGGILQPTPGRSITAPATPSFRMLKTSDAASKPIQTTNSGNGSPPSTKWILISMAISGFCVAISLLAVYFSAKLVSPPPRTGYYTVCSRQGNIYTVDHNNSRVDCIVVNDSVIIDTGSLAVTQKLHNVPIIQIPRDAVVVPGLSDSHGNLLEYGASRQLSLEGTMTISETVARVREYILRTPAILNNPDAFIRGGGWDHTSWPGAAWPTADVLDADPIIKGRLVVLRSRDCHALWVSRRVLELSGPFPASVDGGAILTDASGTATGMLLDNAQELLDIPPLTEHDLMQRFTTAVTDALAYGLTSVHDANLNPALLAFFSRQALRRTIQIRIYAMGFFNETEPYLGNDISKLTPPPSERLTARSVKIFADGALGTGGSGLCEPYTLDSDFPVKTMNPLASFYAAITRVSVNGDSPHGPGGWFPEERLRREEALRGITIDPASVSFSESYLGSLEPGKRADFTVLSRNIMEIPPPEILDVKVMATVIDGAVAYGAL